MNKLGFTFKQTATVAFFSLRRLLVEDGAVMHEGTGIKYQARRNRLTGNVFVRLTISGWKQINETELFFKDDVPTMIL